MEDRSQTTGAAETKAARKMNRRAFTKDSLWFVVVAGCGSFLGSIAKDIFAEQRKARAEERQLLLAFYGEISSILETIQQRGYVAYWQTEAKAADEGHFEPFEVNLSTAENFTVVYKGNADKVGTLPMLFPQKITVFYGHVFAILASIASLNQVYEIGKPFGNMGDFLRNDVRVWQQIVSEGTELKTTMEQYLNLPS